MMCLASTLTYYFQVGEDPNLLKVKNQFEEFLPSTASPQIPIDNFKTVDFQSGVSRFFNIPFWFE